MPGTKNPGRTKKTLIIAPDRKMRIVRTLKICAERIVKAIGINAIYKMNEPKGANFCNKMKIHYLFYPLIILLICACSNFSNSKGEESIKPTLTEDMTVGDYKFVVKDPDSTNTPIIEDKLPLHGGLNQQQVDQYYPGILDTIQKKRMFAADPVDMMRTSNIYVSMLHNAGTSDQMFLCTHDKTFQLLDSYYIGTSTMFDGTSHSIEYDKLSEDQLKFRHVDYGYVNNTDDDEIDTLKHWECVLTLTKTGKIVKR